MTVYKIERNAVITFYLDILKFNKKWENKPYRVTQLSPF